MDDYYTGGIEEVALRDARAGKWETKDGRLIPIAELGDDHLLNILRMLRRQAVADIAGTVVKRLYGSPGAYDLGDEVAMAYEVELAALQEMTWRDALPEIWKILIKEAWNRPAIAGAATAIQAEDMRQAQAAVEIRMIAEAEGVL